MSKKLVIVLAAIGLLILLMVGAGFYVMFNKITTLSASVPTEDKTGETDDGEENIKKIGAVYHLDTFIINLADEDGTRYLRITMKLELDKEELDEELDQRLPQIRDSILMILPDKRYEDINSSKGKEALRDELIVNINKFLNTGSVVNIYYTEFVIQ